MRIVAASICAWAYLAAPSAAQEIINGAWLRIGGIACPSPFRFEDGDAAVRAGDRKWLRQTGCVVIAREAPLTLISRPADAYYRARLHGPSGVDATGYVRCKDVVLSWDQKGKTLWRLSCGKRLSQVEAQRMIGVAP